VVNVPFTGHAGTKPRPALVLSSEAFHRKLPDLIVCPISSQPRFYSRPGVGDRPLRHWKSAGLRHPSTACLSNLMAIEKRLIKRTLAPLHADDLALIEQGLREVFSLDQARYRLRS
jgi:mRNA-degrading endonuclease toxin of MazEF toxin-antitoxin module